MRVVFYFLLVLVFSGCELNDRTSIEKYFTPDEIHELNKIVDFVLQQGISEYEGETTTCISQYLEKLRLASTTESSDLFINPHDQQYFLASIPDSVLNEIWDYSIGKSRRNDTISVRSVIIPDLNGKFFMMLKDLAGQDELISDYVQYTESAGDFSPQTNAILFIQNERFDPTNKIHQLLIAVHVISLNDWSHSHPDDILLTYEKRDNRLIADEDGVRHLRDSMPDGHYQIFRSGPDANSFLHEEGYYLNGVRHGTFNYNWDITSLDSLYNGIVGEGVMESTSYKKGFIQEWRFFVDFQLRGERIYSDSIVDPDNWHTNIVYGEGREILSVENR